MASFGLNTQTIGGMVGLIILFLIIYFVMRLRMHRAEWGNFRERRVERETKKDYGKEIRAIRVAIWKRRAKLIREIIKFKNADPGLIAKLRMQIAMLGKQYDAANKLNSQLKKTFKMMDNGAKETRRVIRRLLRLDRKMNSFDKTVNKTESRVEKKFKEMRESFAKFEKSIRAFESDKDVNSVALSFSAN